MKKLLLVILALTLSAGMWADELEDYKKNAVTEIDRAIEDVTDEDILAIAEKAKQDINAASAEKDVNSIETFALTKIKALVLIQTTRQGIQNEEINSWIDGAFNDIKNGGPDATPGIDEISHEILTMITHVKIGKEEGKAEAKAELLGDMGEPCTNCTAVEVTDGTTTVTLYNPTNVSYIKK